MQGGQQIRQSFTNDPIVRGGHLATGLSVQPPMYGGKGRGKKAASSQLSAISKKTEHWTLNTEH